MIFQENIISLNNVPVWMKKKNIIWPPIIFFLIKQFEYIYMWMSNLSEIKTYSS